MPIVAIISQTRFYTPWSGYVLVGYRHGMDVDTVGHDGPFSMSECMVHQQGMLDHFCALTRNTHSVWHISTMLMGIESSFLK